MKTDGLGQKRTKSSCFFFLPPATNSIGPLYLPREGPSLARGRDKEAPRPPRSDRKENVPSWSVFSRFKWKPRWLFLQKRRNGIPRLGVPRRVADRAGNDNRRTLAALEEPARKYRPPRLVGNKTAIAGENTWLAGRNHRQGNSSAGIFLLTQPTPCKGRLF